VVDEILANQKGSARLLYKGFQAILLKTGEL